MAIVIKVMVAFVALQHIAFLILEMFLWTKPIGLKIFKMTPDVAQQTATLAANQGLYNGFLAAGLIWSLLTSSTMAFSLQIFFLSCVFIAGIYGWYSVSTSILFVQALPAAVTLFVVYKYS